MAEKKKKSVDLSWNEISTARRRGGGKVTKTQREKAWSRWDVSNTRFEKGKGVVNAKGKPFTGTVTLPSGADASYVRGRRLQASPAKPKKSTVTSTGKTSRPTSPSSGSSAKQQRLQANKGVASGTVRKGAKGKTVRQYNAKTGRWGVVYTPGLNTTVRSDRPSTTRPKGPARTSATTRPSTAPKSNTRSSKPNMKAEWERSAVAGLLRNLNRPKAKPTPKGYGRSGNKRYP